MEDEGVVEKDPGEQVQLKGPEEQVLSTSEEETVLPGIQTQLLREPEEEEVAEGAPEETTSPVPATPGIKTEELTEPEEKEEVAEGVPQETTSPLPGIETEEVREPEEEEEVAEGAPQETTSPVPATPGIKTEEVREPEEVAEGAPQETTSPVPEPERGSSSLRNMVASRLFPYQLQMVQRFANDMESTLANTVSEDTTHVIMFTDEDLVCERTVKYFLGIASRKWVVSYLWVLRSLEEGRILNERDFEVRGDLYNGRNHQGPKKARESSPGKLFQGLEICCHGPFTDMKREQLEWMVELCGASLVKEPHLFSCSKVSGEAVVVVQPDAWGEDSGFQGFPPPCGATVVTREWVLDSVSCYQCRTFEKYLVTQL